MTDVTAHIASRMLSVPSPQENEEHLCPCYEQIIGAAYGLITAERMAIRERKLTSSYHQEVRLKLAQILANEEPFSMHAPKEWITWANGFYFNVAIQRLIWVGDRLLTVFGRLPAICCEVVPQIPRKRGLGLEALLEDARNRLGHEHFSTSPNVAKIVAMLSTPFDALQTEVTESNYLRAIRWDVNKRKHAIGGFHRSSVADVDTAQEPWIGLGQDKQFEFALKGFKIICDVYSIFTNFISFAK